MLISEPLLLHCWDKMKGKKGHAKRSPAFSLLQFCCHWHPAPPRRTALRTLKQHTHSLLQQAQQHQRNCRRRGWGGRELKTKHKPKTAAFKRTVQNLEALSLELCSQRKNLSFTLENVIHLCLMLVVSKFIEDWDLNHLHCVKVQTS